MFEAATLADLGEDGALRLILDTISAHERLNPNRNPQPLGPGDDAALLLAPKGSVLISTDALVENIDFRRTTFSPADVGWKAVAVNLSDIGAMGGSPSALTISVGLPPDFTVDEIVSLTSGALAAIDRIAPGVQIVGGDLSRSTEIFVSVTVFGNPSERVVTRSGAMAGDLVALAGQLGWSYLGWLLLDGGYRSRSESIDLAPAPYRRALSAQQRPEPPVALGQAAAAAGATAMIDISDGLVQDAGRIATASGAVIELQPELLATDLAELAALVQSMRAKVKRNEEFDRFGTPAAEDQSLSRRALLSGGEDFALLATFPAGAELPTGFRLIGRVMAGESGKPGVLFAGETWQISGWDHFKADLDPTGSFP